MITRLLAAYLCLERQMEEMDREGDGHGDIVRDALDGIWHNLNADERRFLDSRNIAEPSQGEDISLPFSECRPCCRCGAYKALAECNSVRNGAWVGWECRDRAKCL
jgi:hypothetical protein